MRFHVHQSHRLEDLLERLASRLTSEPLPPLQAETILVPAQGLARWVQLRLAERFGIAAGIRLPFLGGFLQELGRKADPTGIDLFARDVLVWRIWRLLGTGILREELGAAASYCEDDADGRKRFQLCTRLAACFDDYQLYRDDVLRAFATGNDDTVPGPHAAWQANLWRALLRDAGALPQAPARPRRQAKKAAPAPAAWLFPELATGVPPTASPGAAHRLDQLRGLFADPARARAVLPPRLSVFGTGTLPPACLRLLQQIATHVPVDLYVPLPTAHYIGDLRELGSQADHSLLARLGTEAREFADQLVDLEDGNPDGERRGVVPLQREPAEDAPEPAAPTTLLACVQHDIVHVQDRGPGGAPRFRLRADDDSLRVHDCHSPQRELEVVRDHVLAAFADDPTLQPHDVLVLVPDIDRYAPYAHAVFGPVVEHLPFHVADRSPARDLPLCKALLEVLELATSRLHTFAVLHLLEEPSIRRRFALFATDLPSLRHLCQSAGIRWGEHGPSRELLHGLPAFEENSWRQGLDRLLLGTATGPGDDLFGPLLPTADTTEGRVPLLTRFVDFVQTLFARLEPLRRPHSLHEWAQQIDDLQTDLFAPEGGDDDAALLHLRAATAALRRVAATAAHDQPVSPAVLRDWLLAALAQGSGSRGFLAGAVTVAAMLPMRTVPARCLFVCGLDDASFPRRDAVVPFDLIAAARRPGDRSRRLDDRQMFLDVLLAARDRLHLTFVGHSSKDDSPCAPSVVLAELLEHVDRTCQPPSGFAAARDVVVVRQPLQPWSRRYRSSGDPRLFTYSHGRAGAWGPPAREQPWHDGQQSRAEVDEMAEIRLDDLLEFWNNPSRYFVQRVLHLSLPRDNDRDFESEPFALHSLDKYHLQDEALRRAQRGQPPLADPFAHARAEGLLPIGEHGKTVFAEIDEATQRFLGIALRHHANGCRTVRARGADFVVTGEVDGIGTDELVRIRTAGLKPRDKLKGWLLHLVLAVARHQGAGYLPIRTRVIATDESRLLEPFDLETAMQHLRVLVDGYRRGLQAPLPFFEWSSHEFGVALHTTPDEAAAMRKARSRYAPADQPDKAYLHDDHDANIRLCMRGRDPLGESLFRELGKAIWQVAESYLHETTEEA